MGAQRVAGEMRACIGGTEPRLPLPRRVVVEQLQDVVGECGLVVGDGAGRFDIGQACAPTDVVTSGKPCCNASTTLLFTPAP